MLNTYTYNTQIVVKEHKYIFKKLLLNKIKMSLNFKKLINNF